MRCCSYLVQVTWDLLVVNNGSAADSCNFGVSFATSLNCAAYPKQVCQDTAFVQGSDA